MAAVLLLGIGGLSGRCAAQQNPAGLAQPNTAQVKDTFTPLEPGAVQFEGGMLGARFDVNAKNRLLKVDENDMLDAFERRSVPHQDWQGEHVGKFLHAATLAWADTHDPALKAKLDRVVARLLKTQEPDGYLGTYLPEHRWTSWDVWVHKYDLIGLLTYYQFTGDQEALNACKRVGDLLVRTFGTGPGQRDINRAGEHMGMAADSVLEPIALLYRATDAPHYLAFARYIVSNYDAPGGPAILASLEKYRSVRRVANAKAYEMVSNFNGMLELYRITGDTRLLADMQIAWNDIAKNRLYLTGSASSFEVFQDDFHLPNGQRSNICETCVTVTWEQMNLQLLRLTGEAKYADEVERSVYNHLFAAQKPTGDDWAYYTPLEGRKPYDSATTCCHSSGPRGVALLPEFTYMVSHGEGREGVVVNFYNGSTATIPLEKAGKVTVKQETTYPLDGTVNLTLTPEKNNARFPLLLRIPAHPLDGPGFDILINGKEQPMDFKSDGSAAYYTVLRNWKRGDKITLKLPIATRLVPGDHENAGKAAIVRGPLVLALDTAFNPELTQLNRVALATDDPKQLKLTALPENAKSHAIVFQTEGRIGAEPKTIPLYLTPYADAGQDGKSRFEVWIARPGQAVVAAENGSLFSGAKATYSRKGNVEGDIADDDPDTFRVTYDGARADEDWFALTRATPVTINRVVYIHGNTFHDGGWFDTSRDKPRIQVQTKPGGSWQTVATLNAYPNTTATDSAGLQPGSKFEVRFPSISVIAIRIVAKPACGDNPAQAFSSCAELQAYLTPNK